MLFYLARRCKGVLDPWLFLMLGAFILTCGFGHLLEAVTFHVPLYRLSGLVKAATAVASWATVVGLTAAVPRILALRSPQELEAEVAARREAECALQRINAELERRIQQRTADLESANAELREAIRQRETAEAGLRELNATLEEKVRERTEAEESQRRLLDAVLDAIPVALIVAEPDGRLGGPPVGA